MQAEPTSPEPVKQPAADTGGKYALQVASFAAATDAGRLKERLVKKGYPAFVAEADLGAKGVWFRVKIGPYADNETAKKVQALVEKNENLKGFVSRL